MKTDNTESKSKTTCPYCKEVLEQVPQRKKKCPFCNNLIYVRTSLSTQSKVLVTEEESKEIDLAWEAESKRAKWFKFFNEHGVQEKAFYERKEVFSKKIGKMASDGDVFWSLFNELISNTRDLHSLKMIYYEMALFLNEEGKDSYLMLQQAAKMDLMSFKKQGFIKKVRVITAQEQSCEACRQLTDKVFTIEEALEKMPIPCKECSHKIHDENRNFCRCCYVAEIE